MRKICQSSVASRQLFVATRDPGLTTVTTDYRPTTDD